MLLGKVVLLAILANLVSPELSASDSYLDAYSQSNGGAKFVKREGYYPPSDFQPGYPDVDYNKPYPYPEANYGPPKPVYGPPAYPQPQYGPPPPSYGPTSPGSFYGVPHALVSSLIDKIKFKLDLFTIGKIILKLVIFKKIVSLIAILCLLLFIPSLKHKVIGGGHDDAFRSIDSRSKVDEKLDDISVFVWDSVRNFSSKQNLTENCNTTYCKGRKLLGYLDDHLSYDRLTSLYMKQYEK